jgi:SAM-dependent methyltransferase
MTGRAAFDEFVKNYDDVLDQGLRVAGDSKLVFAERRIRWLAGRLCELNRRPSAVLDFGCGIGDSSALILDILGPREYLGVDTSAKSIDYANMRFRSKERRFKTPNLEAPEGGRFDLAYCNGVFHHIKAVDRPLAASYVYQSLGPGGIFSFWENNPWNPGTRYIMSQIAFDRDAEPLSVNRALDLLIGAGFKILQRRFLFVFPRTLSYLRFLEPALSVIPMGAQYHILCQRP